MNNFSSHHRKGQGGYLLEIPLLLFIILIVVVVLIPYLSIGGRKILISIAAVPVLFALYYMIVIPGWTPYRRNRLGPTGRKVVFLLTAILIIGFVVLINLL
jgi:hypothetical protein